MQSETNLRKAGESWQKAKEAERAKAAALYEAMRAYCADGGSEVKAAAVAGVDRMTVRRALGKL